MSVSDAISSRSISEVLHFTTNRGLVGFLASGELKATKNLSQDEYLSDILHKNSIVRPEAAENFDKSEDWMDFVNLSISAINASYMGFSKRWPHNQDVWWCVLGFDPIIMTHSGVYFATTNNGYQHCIRAQGKDGLENLFKPMVRRKADWRAYRRSRADNLPTCQQAEVLYPHAVSVNFLRHVYVQADEDSDRARAWLKEFGATGVEVSLSDAAFQGFPN